MSKSQVTTWFTPEVYRVEPADAFYTAHVLAFSVHTLYKNTFCS